MQHIQFFWRHTDRQTDIFIQSQNVKDMKKVMLHRLWKTYNVFDKHGQYDVYPQNPMILDVSADKEKVKGVLKKLLTQMVQLQERAYKKSCVPVVKSELLALATLLIWKSSCFQRKFWIGEGFVIPEKYISDRSIAI